MTSKCFVLHKPKGYCKFIFTASDSLHHQNVSGAGRGLGNEIPGKGIGPNEIVDMLTHSNGQKCAKKMGIL